MHQSAMLMGERFFNCYGKFSSNSTIKILDVGSYDINGSLRTVCNIPNAEYIGADTRAGKGVDVVLKDPYILPFADESIDIVVSSSCFEHAEMFWISFLEILRVLKSNGLFYLNAPSNGQYHRVPVDCWRFYPDSGRALVKWAKRNNYNSVLLESFTGLQTGGEDLMNDYVAVFLKDSTYINQYSERILDNFPYYNNGYINKNSKIMLTNFSAFTEDQRKLFFK